MQGPAANWINANCRFPAVRRDSLRSLFEANAAGQNCSFVIGGNLLRSGNAALVHWFAGELFVFQLSDAQAAMRGVPRNMLHVERPVAPMPRTPAQPAISLNRLELLNATVSPNTPFVGRVHYEVLASGGAPWCIRMDYEMGAHRRDGWAYPQLPLWGKGMLDISFFPIAPDPTVAFGYKGPMVVFVRLCEMSPPEQAESRRPITNAVATMVDVV